MSIVSIYFFKSGISGKYLLRGMLSFAVCFSVVALAQAQQFTQRDQAEIKYLAQLTLIEYESILNLISNSAISESVLKDAAQNSYDNPQTRIFYSQEVNVVDDLQPSAPGAADSSVRTIKDYIREFSEVYVKSDLETVDFYDFEISNLKEGSYPYIKVKYTAHFKGRHKKDLAHYKPLEHLAELRVERKDGSRWVTYITNITKYNPASPVSSAKEDARLDAAVADDGTFAEKLNELRDAQFAQRQQLNDAMIAQSWQAFDNKRFEEIRLQGRRAEDIRDYAKAQQFYTQALLVKPREAAIAAKLSELKKAVEQKELLESKYRSGDYVEAITAYSKAIAADPKNADYYLGRGRCYEKLNETQAALKDFSAAIKLDNNFAEALSNRAKLYLRMEEPRKAIEDYDQIIRSQQHASAYYAERAKVKVSVGDFKGAMEDYDAAIKSNPQLAVYYYEKGVLQYQQKQLEQAIESFTAAISRDSNFADAYYARGKAYADNQNVSSAAVDFERARNAGLDKEQLATVDNFAASYASAGEEAMKNGDYKNALENFIKIVLLSPADENAWVNKGDAHYKLQDYQNAIQSYTKAIELEKTSLAYYKRGMVHRELKDNAAAKSDFEKFVPIGWQLISRAESKAANAGSSDAMERLAQELAEAWYTLGNAQYMAEQHTDALASLDKALDINKAHSQALFTQGAVQLSLKNYKKAIKDIEKSIKWGIEDSPWIYLALGDAYRAIGQTDYAISIYSYIIDSVDKNFDLAYIRRADSYKSIKQYQLALQDIMAAISVNNALSRDVGLITSKGLMELYESRFQEADRSFDQALSLEQNDAWALYGKASVLASQNKLEESLDLYRKAFQTGKIAWSAIKDDPIIKHVSKQKAFKELVDASLRL